MEMEKLFSCVLTVIVVIGNIQENVLSLEAEHSKEIGNRIHNGEDAKPGQFPWQAYLAITSNDGQRSFCGGSLITDTTVLTAAHCVADAKSITVQLGSTRASKDVEQTFTSTNFTAHEDYNSSLIRNDVGVIYLPEPANETDNVKIIALYEDPISEGQETIVSGFGETELLESGVLKFAPVTTTTNRRCRALLGPQVQDSNICTISRQRKSPCFGDSGGPLIIENEGTPYLIGTVSFGRVCGTFLYPSAYARVSSFYQWIQDHSA